MTADIETVERRRVKSETQVFKTRNKNDLKRSKKKMKNSREMKASLCLLKTKQPQCLIFAVEERKMTVFEVQQ